MAPGMSAFGGKEVLCPLYGGVYNEGAALKLPPKGNPMLRRFADLYSGGLARLFQNFNSRQLFAFQKLQGSTSPRADMGKV